jgi:hypothetical protein
MRRLPLVLGAPLLAAALVVSTAPLAAAQDTGTVYVVHGIPDTPVDVYVGGERALDDFEPGTSAGPVELPAGSVEVAVFPADAEDGSGDPLLETTAELGGDDDVTLVAHLTEDGDPTLTAFANDVSDVPAGEARLVVRHTAAAPAVDVLAGGTAVVEGLTNPNEESLEVEAGTIEAAVAAAGTTDPVIGPAELALEEGTATFVHAIGSLEDDSLDLVVVTVEGLHTPPAGVPSGAPSGAPSVPAAVLAGLLAGTVVLAGAGYAGVTRLRATRAGR